ncbi:MAG TPA: DUF1343 domain-containing protein [Planctomycetota bacterium]|nr:DUF1343 domain-containing protein [Planctomycetota bacterium]
MSLARSFAAAGLLGLALAACDASAQEPARLPARGAATTRVTLGIEVLLADGAPGLAGKRLGLVTNPSGVDSKLVATADLLARDKRWTLVQLFSPEHGVRGDAPAGASVASAVDSATGLPVESLYGDAKQPSAAALERVDAILFDIQDIGSRTYTYISTLGEVMAAAAKAHKPVWVLDRPNPLGGVLFEGPMREERWKSFIGYGPMPVSHGMTIGEVARFFQKELAIDVDLHVVAMRGWRRSMVWEDTGLEWVPTSPHIPHALSAHVYIATGMIGGIAKNVNEGVGWTLPFETIAAEFIDARAFREAMESARLPGVSFRETHYTPRYGKFADKPLHGVQLHLVDLHEFRPLRTALTALCTLQRLYGAKMELESERALGIHWGTLSVFEAIRAGSTPATIEATWKSELESFAKKRAAVLLYE